MKVFWIELSLSYLIINFVTFASFSNSSKLKEVIGSPTGCKIGNESTFKAWQLCSLLKSICSASLPLDSSIIGDSTSRDAKGG